MSYTDEELINLYKEAKDKNKQIGILAVLRCKGDFGDVTGKRIDIGR